MKSGPGSKGQPRHERHAGESDQATMEGEREPRRAVCGTPESPASRVGGAQEG